MNNLFAKWISLFFIGLLCINYPLITIFDKPLKIGDKIIFEDQIHYTIVKNTTFNGIKLPSLGVLKKNGKLEIVKRFRYEDYRSRN